MPRHRTPERPPASQRITGRVPVLDRLTELLDQVAEPGADSTGFRWDVRVYGRTSIAVYANTRLTAPSSQEAAALGDALLNQVLLAADGFELCSRSVVGAVYDGDGWRGRVDVGLCPTAV